VIDKKLYFEQLRSVLLVP